MKTVIVPAEVMSVRDTISGSVSIEQLGLILLGGVCVVYVYVGIEPKSAVSVDKLVLALAILVVFGVLAIRLGGRLVIEWTALGIAYALRGHLFVNDSRSNWGRTKLNIKLVKKQLIHEKQVEKAMVGADLLPVMMVSRGRTRRKITLNLSRKGGLYVG